MLVLGAAFLLLGGYIIVTYTGAPSTGPSGMAPETEGISPSAKLNVSMVSMSAEVNMLGIDVKGGLTPETQLLHFFDPDGQGSHRNPPNQQFTDTKHRYPTLTGTNISTLIHHGYDPMLCPSKRDYDWIVNPPSEDHLGGA